MRFQVISDLHLEVDSQYSIFSIPSCAPNLILAGDIGRLSDYDLFLNFLKAQCENFQQVFLVLGNHEFYGISQARGLELAEQLENERCFDKRLRILNQTRVELANDVTILGCTLHSFITPECEQIVQSKIQDFRRIDDWTIADHNDAHRNDLKWLKANIKQIRSTKPQSSHQIIVVTHYPPVRKGSSRPEHEQNPWTDAFATELLDGSENQEVNPLQSVNYWIFGHTHFSTELRRGRVQMMSNQRGYVLSQRPRNPEGDFSETPSRLSSFETLLGFYSVWQKFKTRQHSQRVSQPFPCQSGFDVRKCIKI